MQAKNVKRSLTVVFLWPVYFLSCLIPRSRNIWVFGSFVKTFADNSKYLFLQQHHLKSATGITPVWITKSKELAEEMRRSGYKSYPKVSLKGLYYCLRASVYIYSWTVRDINFWLSGGARYVSLWHGLPFKMIGADNEESKSKRHGQSKKFNVGAAFATFLYPSRTLAPDVFLSTYSDEITAIFQRTFASKQVLHALYPRVEHFVMPEDQKKKFIDTISTTEEKKLLERVKGFDAVWIYMPTFRDNQEDLSKQYSQEVLDVEKLNAILKSKNILLLVKYHYVVMQSLVNKTDYTNVWFLDSKMDVYVILPYTSGLITDYSSVFFDYMLLQKPMLFYVFDLDAYRSRNRDLYFPYDEVTCGPKITNSQDLYAWFNEEHYKKHSFDYEPYINRFWGTIEKPFLLKQLHQLYNRN